MFEITQGPLDPGPARARLLRPDCGALVEFTGVVRNHHLGRAVAHLEFSAHTELALAMGEKMMQEALGRFEIKAAHLIHRLGPVAIGEPIVWVAVVSAHRKAGYEASMWIMDELKRVVPIWKKEVRPDGTSEWQKGTPLPFAAEGP